ncbi:hypothetical protein G1H11_21660 [Phytoactinopolyspora alkaliphila]|uniref:Uncharacterized protein n=1 Tax=Phytoactinopolyspora alkaliphila TaxID=1783498 RepID=A0A6N9YSI3_9ACTN|nr:hypothetical protein [Phytoactinopolyspora alkaliphila]NED97910.1 hypothetical protein [Phytoactinopolyspora alkaliphila]
MATAWNRTAAKAGHLVVGDRAELADSVEDAVAAGSLVVVCVTDYEAVRTFADRSATTWTARSGELDHGHVAGRAGDRRVGGGAGGAYLAGAIMAIPHPA